MVHVLSYPYIELLVLSQSHISSYTMNIQSSFLELKIYWRQDSTRNLEVWSVIIIIKYSRVPSLTHLGQRREVACGVGDDIYIIIFIDKLRLGWWELGAGTVSQDVWECCPASSGGGGH